MRREDRRRRFAWVALAATLALPLAIALAVELFRLPGPEELRARMAARYPVQSTRLWRPLWAISPQLKEAVVLWEDPTFYHHSGLSYGTMLHAAMVNLRARRYARGGSTITQQVTKNLFLTQEKTLRRKLDDAILARRLEQFLSKEQILEIYLNTAEWGDNIHGAEAAARRYFSTSAARLDWSQAAFLASLLPNPHRYDPCTASVPADVRTRREAVLRTLQEEGRITVDERDAASAMIPLRCAQRAASAVPGGEGNRYRSVSY